MIIIAPQHGKVLSQNVGRDFVALPLRSAKAMIVLARPERLELPTTWFEVMPSSSRSHQINRLARDRQANSAEPCGSAPVDGGQNLGGGNTRESK